MDAGIHSTVTIVVGTIKSGIARGLDICRQCELLGLILFDSEEIIRMMNAMVWIDLINAAAA